MEDIRIYCENDSDYKKVCAGTSLKELANEVCPEIQGQRVIAALVDNKLKELDYRIYHTHNIRFISYEHADGRRTYIRSLCFVLQNVIREMYPDKVLSIDYSLPSGLYCELREQTPHQDGRPHACALSEEDICLIKKKMEDIISRDIPFRKVKMIPEEAIKLYAENNQPEKISLLQSVGRFTYNVYFLDGKADTFYGPLAPSSGYLDIFDISAFNEGFCLQYPMDGYSGTVMPMKRQSKIATALKEHSDWCATIGIRGVGGLNKAVLDGSVADLINLSEALHEKKYAEIAEMIYERRDSVKIVFIAGPSSSGKTSTSKRIALQCRILGMNPKVVELDNYFVNRECTPKDENGEYDFEALEAMDLDFLGKQLNDLLAGKEIEIPRFDFKEGKRFFDGKKMRLLEKDILIMEGIHALNPDMIPGVDSSKVFRVYASALTSLSIDENNNISTSDNRMLRRMIRDNRTRGINPEQTLMMWQSVRRGENRNIFPYQENADVVFNSAHIFELPVLKYYAEPLLRRIRPTSEAYTEATRMLKFLNYIVAMNPEEMAVIPPTSILREFIDGQVL